VDAGAARALCAKGASLLPSGVREVRGEFRRGDVVEILATDTDGANAPRRIARGISQYSAADTRRIAGRRSQDIETLLGYNYGDSVVHRDDLSLEAAEVVSG